MGNSAFNKGQSGNATESGAGVVKLATQTQIDAKQAADGGVPLVATPDKLPNPSLIGQFDAYEDIAAGDAVGLSHYYPQQSNNIYDNSGDADGNQALSITDTPLNQTYASKAGSNIDPTGSGVTKYYAQKFYAPSDFNSGGQLLKLLSITGYYWSDNVFVANLNPPVEIRKDNAGQPTGDVVASNNAAGGEGAKLGATVSVANVELVPGDAYWFVYSKTGGSSGGSFPYAQAPDGTQWIENTTPTAIGASDTGVFLSSQDNFATAGTDIGAGTQQLELSCNYLAMPTSGNSIVQKFKLPSERNNVIWARAEAIRTQINQDTGNIVQAFILDSATPAINSIVGYGAKTATIGLTTIEACTAAEAEQLPLDTDLWLHVIQEVAGTASVQKDSTDTDPITVDDVAYTSTDGGNTLSELAGNVYIMQLDMTINTALGHYEVFKASAAAVNSNRFAFYGYAEEAATAGNPVRITRGRKTGVHTGLTVGRKYYLQDTNGAIGTTPGTVRIELGVALSATELYRDRDTSDWFTIGNGYPIQFEGMTVVSNTTSTGMYWQVWNRCDRDNNEFIFSTAYTAYSEGGIGNARFSPGQQLVVSTTAYGVMIYPQG